MGAAMCRHGCPVLLLTTLVASAAIATTQELAPDPRRLLEQGAFEQAERAARHQVDAARRRHGDHAVDVAVASDALITALLLNGKGAAASTREMAEQALHDKEAHWGPTHADLLPSLLNLGDVLVETGEYRRAIAVLERALAICERAGAADGTSIADALDHLGRALIDAGHHDRALRALERSLQIKEAALGPVHLSVGRTLHAMGLALQRKGEYDRAGTIIRRAVDIQSRGAPAHPDYVERLNLFGLQLWFEGNLEEARAVGTRAVRLTETTLRADHPTTARALRFLAGPVLDLGNVLEARGLLERALAIAERSLGPAHPEMWTYLNDVANVNLILGEYPRARTVFERSLKIARATFGPWHDSVATAVYNLAILDAELGDYRSARREYLRAVAVWERVFGRNHPFVAVALTELAAVYRQQGRPAAAAALLERALAIRERSVGPDHRDVARTLIDLAATVAQTGHGARARELAARAVRIWDGLHAPDAPDYAMVLAAFADVQASGGDSALARQFYERALAIQTKVFGSSHPLVADVEVRLARVLARSGDPQSAVATAVRGEGAAREHLRLMLRYLPERQALNYAAVRPKGLDLILSLAGDVPEAAAMGLDGVIRSRALVLDEMAARRTASSALDAETAAMRAELLSARQRFANLVVRGPGSLAPARYAALIEGARSESERAERALAERSAAFRATLSRDQLGLEQISALLPPDTALVSFVRYEKVPLDGAREASRPGAASRRPAKSATSYLACVARRGEPPVALPLGPAAAIERLVSRWREDVAAETTPPAPGTTRARLPSRLSGAALRQLIWDPLSPYFAGTGRIFIVPDGALNLVPFAALPIGRSAYLIEEAPVIHYLTAERDVARVLDDRGDVGRGLLALGSPAFDAPARGRSARARPADGGPSTAGATPPSRAASWNCGDLQPIRFERLAGALGEVRELAALWKSSAATAGEGVRTLVGLEASERAFKEEAARFRVLHLATHGFFLGGPCAPTAPGTRAIGGLATAPSGVSRERLDNPLLLAGVALAGANLRASARADEEDGILTAEEVVSMNLGRVEWAVLSACDTGLGEVTAGEGVFGLRRAFQVAGVRTVIMSLWAVDDEAGRAWMRALYEERLRKGLSTPDALREASLTMLRTRRTRGLSASPFFWGGFVAAGDWR
jgi:CHAT domain-containing protein/tetratricopeptide (TPR) repeat protein